MCMSIHYVFINGKLFLEILLSTFSPGPFKFAHGEVALLLVNSFGSIFDNAKTSKFIRNMHIITLYPY